MLQRFSLPSTQTQQFQQQILTDPYCRFNSVAEVLAAAELGVRIDVNKAGVDDWLRLPGLSIHQARMLVQLVQGGVQFYAVDDIASALGMPPARLQPLVPILLFCFYDADSPYESQRVNPNTASVEQLQDIPGITASVARGIIRDRISAGPYQNLANFQQRLRLSGSVVQALLPYLYF
ncbi:MAG: helix-hairpin-helix domain-containing protein [Thermosynechococcaceae cyanobacterium]